MDFSETEEQKMVRKMTREYAQNEVKPICREYEKHVDPRECYPWELLKKASKLGLRTLAFPTEYGGGGVTDLITMQIVLEELGAGDHGFGSSMCQMLSNGVAYTHRMNKAQKDEWFPKIIKDDTWVVGSAGTEANSGSDNTFMQKVPGAGRQTFAEKRGDEYIINGTKMYISNGHVGKLFNVAAKTDKKGSWAQCGATFLVPPTTPGFTVAKVEDKLGRRCLSNAEMVFEDMHVPARQLMKEPDAETERLSGALNVFTVLRVALATDMYEACVEYATNRVQGGKPIIRHQVTAIHLSEMRIKIEVARNMLHAQAWRAMNNYEYDPKLNGQLGGFTTEMVARCCFLANDIFAGMGSSKESRLEKLLRDGFTAIHVPTIAQAYVPTAPGYVPMSKMPVDP